MTKRPLLHFIAIGAALFAAELAIAPPVREPIVAGAAELERARRFGGDAEAALRAWADEEMLVREAHRLGLERTDPVVRRRLIQNMRFVGATGDEGALVEQALALGMGQRDVVVRRRLVQAMEQRFAADTEIGEADLHAHMARHPERYGSPQRVSFRHRFTTGSGRPQAFALGETFTAVTEQYVARMFGAEFAQALGSLPVGQWAGPVRSAYGLHEVRVEAVIPAAPGELDAVRQRAHYAVLAERERDAVRAAIQALRRQYPLQVAQGTS